VLITDGHEPTAQTLPALISQAQRQLVGAIRRVQHVGFGNGEWWVGDDVLIGRRAWIALNQDRINNSVFVSVLVKGALERMAFARPIGKDGYSCALGSCICTDTVDIKA